MQHLFLCAVALPFFAPLDGDGSRFGRAVLSLPDLNGDGVRDVAVGAPTQELLGRSGAGVIAILDGQSGEVLGHWLPFDRPGIGHTLALGPDVDGDGLADVLVGFERLPVTEVRSSASGAVIGTLPFVSTHVEVVGDVDGDGCEDILVPGRKRWRGASDLISSAPGLPFTAGAAAYSSSDGSVLWQAAWSDAGAPSRVDLEAFDDVNYDGVPDVFAGTSDAFWHGRVFRGGSVRLISGANGREIWRLSESVAALGDPFENAILQGHGLVIVAGTDRQRLEQMARLRRDEAGARERSVLVLELAPGADVAKPLFGDLPFQLPVKYVRDRFEVSGLDFEVTVVGLDGEAKGYRYRPTEPAELWALLDK